MPKYPAHVRDEALRAAAMDRRPEIGLRDDMRELGEFVLRVNGHRFDCTLRPHGRDVRLWHVLRDGELWLPATGLEKMWRQAGGKACALTCR